MGTQTHTSPLQFSTHIKSAFFAFVAFELAKNNVLQCVFFARCLRLAFDPPRIAFD